MIESDIDKLVDSFATLIPVFMKAVKQVMSEVLLNHDISNVHMQIMFILQHEGQLNMSALGKKIMAPKPNVTVFIDKLIKMGYVERLYNDSDRRIISVRLTESGHNRVTEYMKEMKKYFRQMLNRYSEEDLEILKTSIENLNHYIEKYKYNKEKNNG